MKQLAKLLGAASAILLLVSAKSSAQPITTADWVGNTWNANYNNGSYFPPVVGGVATFTSSDTQWRQIRSITNYVGSLRVVFEINPLLQSGGANGDAALVGVGEQWIYYHENPVGQWVPGPGPSSLAVMFSGGKIYIVDGYGTPSITQVQVGTYTPGQWIQMTLDFSATGYLQVFGPGISASYQSTNLLAFMKCIVAESGSTDGFQLRNLSVTPMSAPQPLTSGYWQGNYWSANVNNGAWFPVISTNVAIYSMNDYSWNQTRSLLAFNGSTRATFEVKPSLNSGGVNPDEAVFGFGTNWVYYHDNPVGQWVPGPGPALIGVLLSGGKVYIVDGYGVAPNYRQLIGTYTPGQWMPFTLDLNGRGVLRVSAPGINTSYASANYGGTNRFIIANANSSDGFQVRNVALGASGNLLAASIPETYFGVDIVDGIPGQTYQLLSTTNLAPPVVWTVETEFVQTAGGFRFVDTSGPTAGRNKFFDVKPKQ